MMACCPRKCGRNAFAATGPAYACALLIADLRGQFCLPLLCLRCHESRIICCFTCLQCACVCTCGWFWDVLGTPLGCLPFVVACRLVNFKIFQVLIFNIQCLSLCQRGVLACASRLFGNHPTGVQFLPVDAATASLWRSEPNCWISELLGQHRVNHSSGKRVEGSLMDPCEMSAVNKCLEPRISLHRACLQCDAMAFGSVSSRVHILYQHVLICVMEGTGS